MPDDNQAGDVAPAGLPARHLILAILVSMLAWAVIFISIPPAAQNFPLGDDWAFTRGAIWFAHGEGIHYSGWASMPELGQWIWSWLFLHVIDLPQIALRISVIVLSWLGLAAFYSLLRQEGITPRLAAFATGVLALNPLFFISSGTYMTDVPALSFALLSLDFYKRAFDKKDFRWLTAAVLFAILAVTTRQTMLAVPVAVGLLLLQHPAVRWKPAWILSLLLPLAVCVYTGWWFSKRTDVLPMHPGINLEHLLFRPFLALHWCGLVVLPLLFMVSRPLAWRIFFQCFGILILIAAYICFFCDSMPYGGLFPYSTGMLSLSGTFTEGLVPGLRDIVLTFNLRIVITILGCLGAARILVLSLEAVRAKKIPSVLLVFTVLQFFIMLTTPFVVDRYLEVLFPGAIFLVATRCSASGPGWYAGIMLVLVSGLLSVVLMHDWLAWNSARWELGRRAVATQNIPPGEIEGGFEWDGWYASADPARPLKPWDPGLADRGEPRLTLRFTRTHFPEVTGRYALAFTEPTNAVTVATQPYSTWLPPAKKEFLFVQEKP